MPTCGVGFGLQLFDNVFVGAGAGDPGVLGELRLHGEADPLLAEEPLQFLKRLQARNININNAPASTNLKYQGKYIN